MNEVLKRDQNFVTVLAGVTDDTDKDIVMLRVHPTTKRLLISADLSGLGYITDAPSDNKIYGRKNASWVEVTSNVESLEDIQIIYNAQDQIIQVVRTSLTKTITYNLDGTVHTVADGTYTKTFVYSDGLLTNVNVT